MNVALNTIIALYGRTYVDLNTKLYLYYIRRDIRSAV